MRFSQRDRDVAVCAQLQANISVPELARATGYREHTVRYSLQRLSDAGVLRPYYLIDYYRLGYSLFEVYFSVASEKESCEKELIETLLDSDQCAILVEFGGEFQYVACVVARNIVEVSNFFDQVSARVGVRLIEKNIACRVFWDLYRRGYLSDKKFSGPTAIRCGGKVGYIRLDETDHRILSSVATKPDISLRERAIGLEMPLSTVDYRIRRLEEQGIIRAKLFSIDPRKFGLRMFRMHIQAKGTSPQLTERMTKFCSEHPNINAFAYVIGSWDYEMACEVESTEHAAELRKLLYREFLDDIVSVKSFPVISESKLALYPFSEKDAFDEDFEQLKKAANG